MKAYAGGGWEEGPACGGPGEARLGTHLLLLLVEVVDDDTDEEVEGEEGPKDDEDDEIEVHVEVHLVLWLLLLLWRPQGGTKCAGWAGAQRRTLSTPGCQGSGGA